MGMFWNWITVMVHSMGKVVNVSELTTRPTLVLELALDVAHQLLQEVGPELALAPELVLDWVLLRRGPWL